MPEGLNEVPDQKYAHSMLARWAVSIKSKFVLDNLCLTSPQDHVSCAPFVNAVEQMGLQYSVLTNTIAKLHYQVQTLQHTITTWQSSQVPPSPFLIKPSLLFRLILIVYKNIYKNIHK